MAEASSLRLLTIIFFFSMPPGKILAKAMNIPSVVKTNRLTAPGGDYIKVEPETVALNIEVIYLDGTKEAMTVRGLVKLDKKVAWVIIPDTEADKSFTIEVGRT
jgi:hypothetical protein